MINIIFKNLNKIIFFLIIKFISQIFETLNKKNLF